MPRVRAASLTNYFEVARFVGLDPVRMLRSVGIDPASLEDPDRPIMAAPVIELLEASARESGCLSFGLLMAESRSVASVGAVGLLVKHQSTAREVVEAVVQYQSLVAEVIAISLEDLGEATLIRTDFVAGLSGPQATEFLMGMVCRTISGVVGGRWHPESAHFQHDAPTCACTTGFFNVR